MAITVNAIWDDEARVFVATSEDVPGLATEASTLDELVAKLKVMIPEMLDANGYADGDALHEFILCSHNTTELLHAALVGEVRAWSNPVPQVRLQ